MIFFLVSLFLFAIFSYAAPRMEIIREADHFLYDLSASLVSPSWLATNRGITLLGEWWVLLFLAAAVGLIVSLRGGVRHGMFYFFWMALGLKGNAYLKEFFGSPRPEFFDRAIVLPSYGYPSGHAFGILVFCLMTVTMTRQTGLAAGRMVKALLVILVCMVSFSRLALGVHWLSDVIGGLLGGFAWYGIYKFFDSKWRATNS